MSYTLTKADVLLVAGELSTLDDARWAQVISFAQLQVSNTTAWGGDAKAKNAAVYLAAHMAKLDLIALTARGSQLASGPVTEIAVGPVKKSFADLSKFIKLSDINASLALTTYGIQFRRLQSLYSFTRGVVG